MGNAAPRAQPPLDSESHLRTYLMGYKSMPVVYDALIGNGKFLKTITCKGEQGSLVVKIYRKVDPTEKLGNVEVALRRLSQGFSIEHQPNIMPYADYQLSTKFDVAFLVRQFFASNLYDRICSRPFLTKIEKKWIAYQILRALEQCHSKGICHGDIKQENIMVTSWNWIYLTDFAPFKPTYIPEDDPADYNYYFCAIDATRRGCSVAPERFYGKTTTRSAASAASGASKDATMLSTITGSQLTMETIERNLLMENAPSSAPAGAGRTGRSRREGNLLESMDVFSAGCVIAELFLGGKPLFDLPSLLKYRTGDGDYLKTALRKVDDPQLEELLLHMLQLDPRARLSASEYLVKYTGWSPTSLFPGHFENFTSKFMALVLGRGGRLPDARIRLACKYYGRIVREVAGVEDPDGERFFMQRMREGYGSDRQLGAELASLDGHGHVAQRVLEELDQRLPSEADRRALREGMTPGERDQEKEKDMTLSRSAQKKKIERLNEQFQALTEKKKHALGNDIPLLEDQQERGTSLEERPGSDLVDDDEISMYAESRSVRRRTKSSLKQEPWDHERNGIVIILSLVCSSLRHVQVPESKITAIHLLRHLGKYTSDEVRLQRLVPYLLEVVDDSSATVRAVAIRSLTAVLSLVKSVPLSDANIFPQYILPQMSKFPVDADELVRITFAECLPLLASTSRRFLEIAHSMKQRSAGASPASGTSATGPLSGKSGDPSTAHVLFLSSSNFDKELNRLHKMVSRFVIQLAAPDQKTSSPLVKRALLADITRLCIFFGRERTLDVVLPQLITFLNDRDWELRGAFFEHITGVGAFVGRVTVELYILPCIEMALFDVQEIVITKALDCLSALCQLGLFQKSTSALADKAKLTCSLLLHPSWWIRDAVLQLMSYIAAQMGSVDANVFLGPLLRPFLKKTMVFMVGESEADALVRLRDCCRPFVSRETFDAALFASSAPGGGAEGSEMEGFVSLSDDTANERGTGARGVLSSVDSLDNYSVGRLPPPAPVSATSENGHGSAASYEQKKNEQQALKLMQQYVAIASMHMRSKVQLAESEQNSQMQGGGSGIRKLPRSSLHVLYVPDMRFALSVAQPIKATNVSVTLGSASALTTSTAIVPAGGRQASAATPRRATGSLHSGLLENVPVSLIVKMYGLVAPNLRLAALPASLSPTPGAAQFDESGNGGAALQMQPMIDTNHFATADRTMLSMISVGMRDIYGGESGGGYMDYPTPNSPLKRTPQYSSTSGDPALSNARKMLARLAALGVPPLPPDLGALRFSEGTPYSIYAHQSSPYSMLQSTAVSTSSGNHGVDRGGGLVASPSSAGPGGAFGAGAFGSIAVNGSGPGVVAAPSFTAYRNWRPRKNVLAAELAEHTGAVNRIAPSQDFSFLASASNDGTVKLWSIRSMLHSVNQGSRATYDGQGGVLTDMVVLDNSHSVASASSNGTVHVFRVDKVSSKGANFHTTGLRELRTQKSAITVLDHLNNVTESLLVYATRNGSIHAWDLRTRREAWKLEISPELGYVTCITHSLDVSWLAAGTSRGFICLWDLRFLVLIRIWRHSSHRSIHRLKPCLGLPNTLTLEETSVPLVFVAAGDAEVAVFDLSIGACRAIFRTLHVQAPDADACRCPTLLHVPIPHRNRTVLASYLGIYGIATAFDEIATTPLSEEPSVRALLCPSLHFRGVADALITGGEEKQIRYWDIRNGKQSFTVCGDGESKSFYDNQSAPSDWWRMSSSTGPGGGGNGHAGNSSSALDHHRGDNGSTLVSAATMAHASSSSSYGSGSGSGSGGNVTKPELAWSKLSAPIITICQDASYFAAQGGLLAAAGGVESAVAMERRGLVPPSPAHNDCILDLTLVDLNGPMLVSSGRDGVIKAWK